jgi:photosynthetic reaction center cytochrome c subunit
MHRKLISVRRAITLSGIALSAVLIVHAQGAPPVLEGKTAEQFFKNIQVLKGTPAEQLNQTMHLIKGDVGLDCEDCHEEKDRAADTKELKETARKMMRMVIELNKNSFGGQQTVTCYTCHRGSPIPLNTPILPVNEAEETSKITLPSVDQVLAKYVEALGGEQAIRKIMSRVITGTEELPTGPGGTVPMPATIERDLKAPNLVLEVHRTPGFTISNGFDGKAAWAQDPRGRVTEALKIDQSRARRDADFYEPLNLKQEYAKLEVQGIERVNGHDTYVVVGTPQGDLPERLYFDILTGLLLRKESVLLTAVGNSPFQVNYTDYRDTGSGAKFPYLITIYPAGARTELATTSTIRVLKVQDNLPIDTAKFAKPASAATGAQ